MPSKNRNRNRRQNQRRAKEMKRVAVITGLRKRDLPDALIELVLMWKADMENWIVAMNKVMCTFHTIYIQAKAVEGFLLMPEASDIPEIFRQRMAGHLQTFQKKLQIIKKPPEPSKKIQTIKKTPNISKKLQTHQKNSNPSKKLQTIKKTPTHQKNSRHFKKLQTI